MDAGRRDGFVCTSVRSSRSAVDHGQLGGGLCPRARCLLRVLFSLCFHSVCFHPAVPSLTKTRLFVTTLLLGMVSALELWAVSGLCFGNPPYTCCSLAPVFSSSSWSQGRAPRLLCAALESTSYSPCFGDCIATVCCLLNGCEMNRAVTL